MPGAKIDYILHYFRRLQDNNFDVSILASGAKGFGKSTAAIYLTLTYIDLFSFVCPHCGSEFYKNVYKVNYKSKPPIFYLPDYVTDDTADIQCPIEYKLDMKSGQKNIIRGCGNTFKWSQRKKIKWSAEKFIAYNNKDLIRKIIKDLPMYSPIIVDEAMNVIAGQMHNKAENKYLKEKLTVIRPKRYMMFYCIPEQSWLDSKLREGFSSFWLRMIERGEAVLFEKDKGESKDKYHIKEMEKALGVIKFFTPMEKIKRKLTKHPCYFDSFPFPELPEKIYNEYELVRNAVTMQHQAEEMELSNKDIAKMMAWNIMKNWDRIKISVDKSREAKPTYSVFLTEIAVNPSTRQSLVSEMTVRNWVMGVERFVETQGKDAGAFDGDVTDK